MSRSRGQAVQTLALVLTDVVGSTRLWADEPDAMDLAMARHHKIVHAAISDAGGFRPVDQGEGDAVFAAFASPASAVCAAVVIQRALAAETWPTSRPLTVRIAIHVGEVRERDGNLFGDPVNRTARIRGVASGGQVLVSTALHELVRDCLPAGVRTRDLGEHRMKDLARAERIYQLDIAGLVSDFPPLASLERARHNLPVQVSSFVGREDELAELRQMLAEHRLVTLTGFGGMGKTRLALQVAAELAEGDGDGVWFVDLSAETDPDRVPSAIAAALGIAETGDGAAAAVLRGLAGQRLLVVLDNLEQIAGCAAFLAELLAAAPDLHVLATSRAPLGIRGEHEYALQPLGFAGGRRDPERLGSNAAVQLFLDRAVEARHDFAPTDATAPVVAEICDRLDGHPLSLELAAARVKALSPQALLNRLDAALAVLAGGGGDRPQRQQTLRATITWSYDLLAVPEQLLLDCLSVFPGTAALDAIEAICGPLVPDIDPLDGVMTLIDSSLVRVHEPYADGSDSRYSLLVPIRAYAAERLTTAGLDHEVAARHAAYFRARQVAVPDDTPEHANAQDLETQREMHNLRAALAYYRAYGEPDDEAAFVEGPYATELVHGGWLADAEDLASRTIARAGGPSPATSAAHFHLGWIHHISGRMEQARREAQAAIDDALAIDNLALVATAAISALSRARDRDDMIRLLLVATDAVERLPVVGNSPPRWNVQALYDGAVANALVYVDHDRALACARSRLASALAMGDAEDIVMGSYQVVDRLCDVGDYSEAIDELTHGRGAHVDDMAGVERQWILRTESRLRLGLGELDEALRTGRQALELCEHLGTAFYTARAHLVVADALYAAGDLGGAMDALRGARTALIGTDDLPSVGAAEWRLAHALRLSGEPDPALLADAWKHLAGQDVQRLPDVLGCLVERAVEAASTDPNGAARLLGLVRAHRQRFVLPMSVANEIEPLLDSLRSQLGDDELKRLVRASAAEGLPTAPPDDVGVPAGGR